MDYGNILILSCRPHLPHIKLFKKTEGSLELVALLHFLHDFYRKIFLLLYSITCHNFIICFPLDIGKYVHCNCLLTRLRHHQFWNWSYLFNQAGFFTWSKGQDKQLKILRTKMKQKAYSIIFERFSLKQIKEYFLEGHSATLKQFSMRNFPLIISSISLQITACLLF